MPIVSLILDKTTEKQVFEVEEGDVLFDALDNKGKTLAHGCLAGSCGACRIEVLAGSENLKPASAVEQDTIEAICSAYKKKHGEDSLHGRTVRLACRARVLGDVTVKPFR